MLSFLKRTSHKEYHVPVNSEEWVAPEETLVDSASDHSDMEMPISAGVFRFAVFGIGAAFLAVVFFSWRLSILHHSQFATLAVQNKTVNFAISPPRGAILDRTGIPLVSNVPNFDLLAVSREVQNAGSEDYADALSHIFGIDAKQIASDMTQNMREQSVFFVATNLTKDQVLAIQQANLSGLYVITGTKRQYVDGPQFSHIIGYVGKVNANDLEQDSYYLPSDTIGRLGVESSYEKYLRGTHGQITFTRKDASTSSREPVIGDTIQLNIDYDLQKELFNDVYNAIHGTDLSGAAAIVQNPQNGEVLGMVSLPEFDNNIFSDAISPSQFKALFQSKARPLFNRVISGLYNPGSTIKPFIGMAALQRGVITPSYVIRDCISITVPNPFNPDHPYVFKNWRTDLGLFNLRRSIANSCNVFFFTIGGGFGDIVGLGIEQIAHFLHVAHADSLLGIDLPGEVEGFIPTPDWKEAKRGEPWYQGDTYNVSIGQGDLLVTPLWLNTYISAIANGGKIYEPHVAHEIRDPDKNVIQTIEPKVIGELPFKPEVVAEMRSDMHETVLTGTAKLLQDVPVPIGAKTGTAEVIKGQRINALFTAFAPLNDPQVSITVLAEGSHSNQGYAIRIANDLLRWYFTQYSHQQ